MSSLADITPLILTFNEDPNIERTLSALTWAQQIVVVDSLSCDRTLEILQAHPKVTVVQRAWDTMAQQWNFGLKHVKSEWVLSLDADYVVTEELMQEIEQALKNPQSAQFMIPFRYCVFGKPLRASILPPRCALFRHSDANYYDDGHTQRLRKIGNPPLLRFPLLHDDRKPLRRWLMNQVSYAELEVKKLRESPRSELSLADRVRCWIVVAPVLVPLYCLIGKGCLLDGWRGVFYAFQRSLAELVLSLLLLEERLRRD